MIKFPIMLTGYAIYNPNTGEYSKGGNGPWWGKNPKIWELGPLKNHLNLFINTDYRHKTIIVRNPYIDCQIIDVTTGEESNLKIVDLLEASALRQKEVIDKTII